MQCIIQGCRQQAVRGGRFCCEAHVTAKFPVPFVPGSILPLETAPPDGAELVKFQSFAIVGVENVIAKAKADMERCDIAFGNAVRDARLRMEKSIRDLAKTVGISSTYLNDIENGDRHAPPEVRETIIKAIL